MSSPGRRWGRWRIGALGVGFALFGVFALRASFLGGPALNSDLRVDSPWGDWRASTGIALYYENLYLREHALKWLEIARDQRDPEAARTARDLLRQSLALQPANAFGWNLLAWSELTLKDVDAARAALFASWRTAPYSADLSISRLLLASSLAMEEEPEAQGPILGDLRVGRRKAREAYESVLRSRPRLKPLADTLDTAEPDAS